MLGNHLFAYRVTGTYVRAVSIIIGRDIIKFMIVLVLTTLVFSGSFYFAARYDDSVVAVNGTNSTIHGGGRNADQTKFYSETGLYVCGGEYIHVFVHACVHMCMHVFMCACMYGSVHVYVCICT